MAEQLHTALQVITCGASSVISGTCHNTLCVLPLRCFAASQIQQMMALMLLPAMCAQLVESVVSLVVTASAYSKTRTALHLQMDSWCHPTADTISESVVVSNGKASQSSSPDGVTYQMGEQVTSMLSEMMGRLDEAPQLVVLVLELQTDLAATDSWTGAVMQAMIKLCDCFDASSSSHGDASSHAHQSRARLVVVLDVVSGDEKSEKMDAHELSEVVNSCMQYLIDVKYGSVVDPKITTIKILCNG